MGNTYGWRSIFVCENDRLNEQSDQTKRIATDKIEANDVDSHWTRKETDLILCVLLKNGIAICSPRNLFNRKFGTE